MTDKSLITYKKEDYQPNFFTINHLPILGLYFFESRHLGQMLHSVDLYCHSKNQNKTKYTTMGPGIYFLMKTNG